MWTLQYEEELSQLLENEFLDLDTQAKALSLYHTLRWNRWRVIASFLGMSTNEAYDLWIRLEP